MVRATRPALSVTIASASIAAGAVLLAVPNTAFASPSGDYGGGLLVLGILELLPWVLFAVEAILLVILSLFPLFSRSHRGMRRSAIAGLIIAGLMAASLAARPAIVGGTGPSGGDWALLVAALAATGLMICLAHLHGDLSRRGWLIVLAIAWSLPALVPVELHLAERARVAELAERERYVVQRLRGHALGTFAAAYVDAGEAVFAVGDDYDWPTTEALQRYTRDQKGDLVGAAPLPELPARVAAASIDPVHRRAIVAADAGVWVIDLDQPDRPRTLPASEHFSAATALDPHGRYAAATGAGGTRVWSLIDDGETHLYHLSDHRIDVLGFDADGTALIVAGFDRLVKVVDLETDAVRCSLHGDVTAFAIAPDRKTLVGGGRGPELCRWDLHRCVADGCFATHEGGATAMVFSPDGRHLAVGDWNSHVILYSWPDGGTERQLGVVSVGAERAYDYVTSLDFRADGSELLAAAHGNYQNIAIFRLPR